jgi:hypothetical protein
MRASVAAPMSIEPSVELASCGERPTLVARALSDFGGGPEAAKLIVPTDFGGPESATPTLFRDLRKQHWYL